MTELADRVKAARDLLGLSQRALSKKAGLSPTYVCQLEAEAEGAGTIKQPALDTLDALAGALNCTRQWLAFGVGPGPKGLRRARAMAGKKAS